MGSHTISRPDTGSSRQVLDHLRRIVQALRVGSRISEARTGLSGAQLFVLQKLAEEDSLSVNDLAGRTLTHQSSVSVVVQRLVDAKLIERSRSPEDARRLQLSITPAGRAILRRSPQPAQERLINALSEMKPQRRVQLASLLNELITSAGFDGEAPSMFFESDSFNKKSK